MTEHLRYDLVTFSFVGGLVVLFVLTIYAIVGHIQYTKRLMEDCMNDGNKEYVCYNLIHTYNVKK